MENFVVKLTCNMVELYIKDLRDLLIPPGTQAEPIIPKEDPATKRVVLKNCSTVEIESIEQCEAIFGEGLKRRMVRKTNMNDESSRSHLIFSIMIDTTNTNTNVRNIGKLTFCDLAGSEKSSKTGTTKQGQEEANAINMSLSALGSVITALSTGGAHVPYRDHPLTMVLRDSLGGTAKTLMFVNASPSIYNEAETKNSLEYATRVKKIKNSVTKNTQNKETLKLKQVVSDLSEQMDQMSKLLLNSDQAEAWKALEQQFVNQLDGQ